MFYKIDLSLLGKIGGKLIIEYYKFKYNNEYNYWEMFPSKNFQFDLRLQ